MMESQNKVQEIKKHPKVLLFFQKETTP